MNWSQMSDADWLERLSLERDEGMALEAILTGPPQEPVHYTARERGEKTG